MQKIMVSGSLVCEMPISKTLSSHWSIISIWTRGIKSIVSESNSPLKVKSWWFSSGRVESSPNFLVHMNLEIAICQF